MTEEKKQEQVKQEPNRSWVLPTSVIVVILIVTALAIAGWVTFLVAGWILTPQTETYTQQEVDRIVAEKVAEQRTYTQEEIDRVVAKAVAEATVVTNTCGCETIKQKEVEGHIAKDTDWGFAFTDDCDSDGFGISSQRVTGPAIVKPNPNTNDLIVLGPGVEKVLSGIAWTYKAQSKEKAIEGLRAQYQFFPGGQIEEIGF